MPATQAYPKVHLTPLRGDLKVADVKRAVRQVKAERESQQRARAAGSR